MSKVTEGLSCGDEIRVGARTVYYGVVLAVRPRLVLRIRRGGPHGRRVADLAFDRRPSRGELLATIAHCEAGDCPGNGV